MGGGADGRGHAGTDEGSMMSTAELLPAVVNGVGFRHSESFAKLAEALVQAQGEFGSVKKDTENPYYHAKYATLDSIIEATRPALLKYGLAVVQSPRMNERTVTITTLLLHKSGEWIADDLSLPAEGVGKDGKVKFDPQTCGSAIAYGRRYSYQSFLCIAAEEDDDGNAASGVRQPQRVSQTKPQPVRPLQEARNPFGDCIAPLAQKQFMDAALRRGQTQQQIANYLGSEGMESVTEMKKRDYEKHMAWAEGTGV